MLVKLSKEEQAFDAWRHAQELNPQDKATSDSLYFLSLKLAERNSDSKQYSNALPYLSEAAKLRPQEAEPHKQMAEAFVHLGKPVQADAEKKEAERLGGK